MVVKDHKYLFIIFIASETKDCELSGIPDFYDIDLWLLIKQSLQAIYVIEWNQLEDSFIYRFVLKNSSWLSIILRVSCNICLLWILSYSWWNHRFITVARNSTWRIFSILSFILDAFTSINCRDSTLQALNIFINTRMKSELHVFTSIAHSIILSIIVSLSLRLESLLYRFYCRKLIENYEV